MTPATEGWREQMLRIADSRIKYLEAAKRSALEHNEFIEAAQLLGLDEASKGTYKIRYAQGFEDTGGGSYAEQGSTVYGRSVKEVVEGYGNLVDNLDVHWNQADNHTTNAQKAAQRAEDRFKDLLSDASKAKERVATILAKKELLKAVDTPEVTVTREERSFSSSANSSDGPSNASLVSVVQGRCISCHSAQNPQGGVDMSKYLSFDENKRKAVQAAITSTDPEKRMPKKKTADGKFEPGEPLSFAEIVVFK